jgi:hypothetical protein
VVFLFIEGDKIIHEKEEQRELKNWMMKDGYVIYSFFFCGCDRPLEYL